MKPVSGGTEGIQSELVDLGSTPLAVLRTTDNAALQRSLRRVVERAGALRFKRISANGTGGGRID